MYHLSNAVGVGRSQEADSYMDQRAYVRAQAIVPNPAGTIAVAGYCRPDVKSVWD